VFIVMPPVPKKIRFKCREYLDFVKQYPCIVPSCGRGPTDPHHAVTVGAGGSDLDAVPLCRRCHDRVDEGRHTFQRKYGVNFAKEQALLLKAFIECKTSVWTKN